MLENTLSQIGGIGIYGVISISLFFLVFCGVLLRTCRLRKPFLDAMRALPLQEDQPGSLSKGDPSHD